MSSQLLTADRKVALEELSWAGFDKSSLAARVEQAFRATGYLQLRHVDVSTGCVVRLRGRVSTYYLKQLAQAIVLNMPEVCHVCNEIDVISHR